MSNNTGRNSQGPNKKHEAVTPIFVTCFSINIAVKKLKKEKKIPTASPSNKRELELAPYKKFAELHSTLPDDTNNTFSQYHTTKGKKNHIQTNSNNHNQHVSLLI